MSTRPRILLNALTLLSLLACAAIAAVWVRSYSAFDYLKRARSTPGTTSSPLCVVDSTYVGSADGRVSVWRIRDLAYTPHDEPLHYDHTRSVQLAGPPAATVPHALIAGAAAILPLLRVRHWRQRRTMARTGRCRACGYDLRATPNRCPECGQDVAP